MKLFDDSSIGLRLQILFISLLPGVLMSVALTVGFIWSHTSDRQYVLLKQGQTIAKTIAANTRETLLSNNLGQMLEVSASHLEIQEVDDVIFLDISYKILSRSATFDIDLIPNAPSVYHSGRHWYFVQAVSAHTFTPLFFSDSYKKKQPAEIIGWVIVLLSDELSSQQDFNILASIFALIVGSLLFSFWFSCYFTREFLTPLVDVIAVVEAFQTGNYNARAREFNAGKLDKLAKGINKMAIRVKDSATDMEIRVDSATRRLQSALYNLEQQNSALKSSKEKEVEANQAKDQFLARMSHELRTPLTSVLGFSKILQAGNITVEQTEPIRIINHTSQLLLSIVDDILDYSKLQKNAIKLERIDFNVETAILDILEMQAPMAHSKGLELSLVSSNRHSYEIKGDPTRFKQIISNLISNAIKFTDTGSVDINAQLQSINTHQSLIIISVCDTGIGMSNAQLNSLFKTFMQADTSITRRFGGSGLGLVIAKTLTHLMGGKIEISSKQGRGTTVTLQIPILINTESKRTETLAAPHSTVLIYDENRHCRRSIGLMLERKKHPYKSVSDQQDLIALLPNYPHLVIGIKSTDIKNQLIHKLLPLITDKHKTVTFALPSHHPLPVLPNIINVINKPIRPEFIIPKDTIIQDPQSASHQTTLTNPEIRVVVAEDNYFNQILIANILEMNNIKSYIASNGREALELIAQQQPDLAIIDIHMPVMDGFEATKIIRKNGDLPIISLTANIIVQDHQKIIAAGSNCIVLKPINADELIRHIRDLTKASVTKQQNQPLLFTSESDTFSQAATVVQYEVDKSVLNDELARLLARLESAFVGNDISKMHSVAHQLIGIAGLYELPAVELTTIELQTKLKAADIRDSWVCLARLKRIINHPEDA